MKTKKSPIRYWVLAERHGEDNRQVRFFHEWTGIGPRYTGDRKKAQQFPTQKAAMDSPAFTFGLAFFEPKAVRGRG